MSHPGQQAQAEWCERFLVDGVHERLSESIRSAERQAGRFRQSAIEYPAEPEYHVRAKAMLTVAGCLRKALRLLALTARATGTVQEKRLRKILELCALDNSSVDQAGLFQAGLFGEQTRSVLADRVREEARVFQQEQDKNPSLTIQVSGRPDRVAGPVGVRVTDWSILQPEPEVGLFGYGSENHRLVHAGSRQELTPEEYDSIPDSDWERIEEAALAAWEARFSDEELALDGEYKPLFRRREYEQQQGWTGLMWEARHGSGRKRILSQVRDFGDDPNARNPADGQTALHIAAKFGHGESVEALLEVGSNSSSRDDSGATPLLIAARYAAVAGLDALKTLLQTTLGEAGRPGREIAAWHETAVCDHHGQTPLIAATINPSSEAVRLLLEAGANPELRDQAGKSPLDYAKEMGATAVQTALEEFGNPPRVVKNAVSDSEPAP